MKQFQQPKLNITVEHFKFNCSDRRSQESIATYVSEFRRLSKHYHYRTFLNDMIRDRLVFGIKHIKHIGGGAV